VLLLGVLLIVCVPLEVWLGEAVSLGVCVSVAEAEPVRVCDGVDVGVSVWLGELVGLAVSVRVPLHDGVGVSV
jgi:hypothetical protein